MNGEFSVLRAIGARDLVLLMNSAEMQLPEEFNLNLNKALKMKRGTAVLQYESSDFQLRHIIAKLPSEQVHAMIITTKMKHNITLFGIEIHLCSGKLILDTSYFLWQKAQAFKIVHHMLVPMLLYGLDNKVFFNNERLFDNSYSFAFNKLYNWVKINNPQELKTGSKYADDIYEPTEFEFWQQLLKTARYIRINFNTIQKNSKFYYITCPQTRKWEYYLDYLY